MRVLIVGAGPAGGAAAITARRAGAEVTILEQGPARRARAGETLHPGVEPVLDSLGVRDVVLAADYQRFTAIAVQWANREEIASTFGSDAGGAWRGFHVRRDDFDMHLIGAARELGATIRENVAVLRPLCDRGRVVGVLTSAGPMDADVTIDASGARHWLAAALHVPLAQGSPRLVATYGYALGASDRREPMPRLHTDDTGWTWVAEIAPDRFAWVRVTRPEQRPRGNWLPDDCAGMREMERRGADVTWRTAARAAGPGWWLCGDAAGVIDPCSSHGVLRALMSGRMAAHLAVSSRTPRDEASSAAVYDEWIQRWMRHDQRALANAYREARLFGY